MIVLVIALNSDIHADAVVNQLHKQNCNVVRIDPTVDSSLPSKICITSDANYNAVYKFENGECLDVKNIDGIFCRFAIDSLGISEAQNALQRFATTEQIAAFLAPLRLINSNKWINDPWIEARVDCRIFQSCIARSLGLNVPDFIVSTSYNDLISFHSHNQNVVIKALSDSPLAQVGQEFIPHELLKTDDFYAPYTVEFNPITNREILSIDDTPTLLQVKISKKSDIRVTIVDRQVFAAEIPYEHGAPLDFRRNANAIVQPFKLPKKIERCLVKLISILKIRFASCDLVLDENGKYYFLEANVEGNWLWTEISGGLPISSAIANALLYHPKTN